MTRFLAVAALVLLLVGAMHAQPGGNARPGRGPDAGRPNPMPRRHFDRPFFPIGQFGYVPVAPYGPQFDLYPPYFFDGPIIVPVPFDPFFPLSPTRWPGVPVGQAPAAAGNNANPNANNPPAPPPKQAPPPAPAKDELDQRAEMLKHIRGGTDALAAGEYHTAVKRYQEAVSAAPLESAGYFHLAQAQLALGRYASAVVSIQRGLRMHPKWPESGFQPRVLYRDRGNDYDQHLGQLADAVAKNLNDDSLLFLLGYQLWFDGRRDEGTKLFERAAGLAFDTLFVDRFLKATKVAGP